MLRSTSRSKHRRRFRRPVLSRLSWAWLAAGGVFVALGGAFLHAAFNDKGAARIALPVGDIEYLARPAQPAEKPRPADEDAVTPVRLAAPALREAGSDSANAPPPAQGDDATDALAYPDADDFFAPDAPISPEDIVITIAGESRRSAALANAASLTPLTRPIPDPDPAMLRATPLGKTPRIAPDGRKALSYYARPYEGDGSKPRIAVIVGGLGLNPALTEQAIEVLPPNISLAFAPYAKDLEYWTGKARAAGHEILIELPMEGYGPNQEALGAAALLSTRTQAENLQRLDWLLSRFGGYFAATNYMGAKFSAETAAIAPILEQLRKAGVGYVDDTGAAGRAARTAGAAMASVNRMIPPAPDNAGRQAVRRELQALERLAAREGAALAKTYAYAATIDEIAAWAGDLETRGFSAAPASAALRGSAASR